MTSIETITLPSIVARRLRREAERLGISVEEYLLELLSQNLDPQDRAWEYIEAAGELLEQARIELRRGDLRQAAEKAWGAAALAVKAYAYWKEGKKLKSHGELWGYKDVLVKELGEWVRIAWNAANSMHTCFYEGWCTLGDVENALEEIEKLVKKVKEKIKMEQA